MGKRKIDIDDIVLAASDLIDERGVSNVTMADVASALEVAGSALYHHIAGLDELHVRLATSATAELGDRLRDALVATSGNDAIVAIAQTYRSFATEHPGQFELAASPPSDDLSEDDSLVAAHRHVADLFITVARSVGFDGDDAAHWARLLRSSVHGFVSLEAVGAFVHAVDPDDSFDQLIESTIEALAS